MNFLGLLGISSGFWLNLVLGLCEKGQSYQEVSGEEHC